MLLNLLLIFILIVICPLIFNYTLTLNLTCYILVVISIFLSLIYSIMTYTFPWSMFVTFIIISIIMLFKHRYLFSHTSSRLFIKKLLSFSYKFVLYTSALLFISTIQSPIVKGLSMWLAILCLSLLLTFICYLVWTVSYRHRSYNKEVDIIIVLGAGIFTEFVTPMLAARLDRALDIYQQQASATKIIVSGGQGPDEPISEALAMQRYLIAHGVDKTDILMESHSINTYTNFLYSKQIINNLYHEAAKIVCVTSQFHVLRALRLAQKLGLSIDGVGSHTPYHFFLHVLIKDYLGVMYQYRLLLTLYCSSSWFICLYAAFIYNS
ncbi:TPA: YdcF family protein [Staphylococcus aureus]|nr:YdcF family protein [Staphylococcus aureus]HEI8167531.1 YdcF family protein [Staphylococcus aureus]